MHDDAEEQLAVVAFSDSIASRPMPLMLKIVLDHDRPRDQQRQEAARPR